MKIERKPVSQGTIREAIDSVRYDRNTLDNPPWFGPNQPLNPVAPPEVKGRAFDYPVGVNLNYTPRMEQSESGISFEVLQRAADPALGGLDLLRLAIETVKDEMSAQPWDIQEVNGGKISERAKKLKALLRRPDGWHSYFQWSRMLWEDHLVLDAPTIYFRFMPDGRTVPEVLDGAKIKILCDGNGRLPQPPTPEERLARDYDPKNYAAYQHILKGVPAVDYLADELYQFPRNVRSNKFYGMPPVEQILNIINLALKRQLSLLAYYTDGNVPAHLIGAPETWNAEQIKLAQQSLDSIFEGNVRAKRRLHIISGAMTPIKLQDPILHEGFDEWLARLICWAFSLPPTALIKTVNRATAQSSAESAQMQGLVPRKLWWKDVMDQIIFRTWGIDDLEFAWRDTEILDQKMKAEVTSILVGKKPIITQDEARAKFGYDPATPEQKEELTPMPAAPMGGSRDASGNTMDEQAGLDADKVAKRRSLRGAKAEQEDCTCGVCKNRQGQPKVSKRYP